MGNHRSIASILAALAPLGVAASGCSNIGEFESKICLTESASLLDLAPDEADYVALRQLQDNFEGSEELPTQVAKWGTPCLNASDPEACQAELEALTMDQALATSGFDLVTSYDIAFTRGDEVGSVSTPSDLILLLGTIDSPGEAVLVAFANGHEPACGYENVRENPEGGFVVLATQGNTCGGNIEHFEVSVDASGSITVGEPEIVEHGDSNCAIGRRPCALRSRTTRARSVGHFFANAAHLEAASIPAFEQLAAELSAHRAPRSLVRAAWRARADEVRHTRVTARLARRYGASPIRPLLGRPAKRDLYEMALDNATEGCVRETFGALVATVQAQCARDVVVRRCLRRIAVDETRHASLSWAVDGWARKQLSAAQRRSLDEARRGAVAQLRSEVARDWPRDVALLAGMPGADASLRMVAGLDAALWRIG